MTFRSPALLPALFLLSTLALTGCGLGTPATSTPETLHLNLTGSVHGGQQPVAGARIFIFQAATNGYNNFAADLIAHSPNGPALVKAQGGGVDDTLKANYTVTNALGAFTITGDYQCVGTGPVYVLATQGNPGLGAGQTNPALAELAVVASACNFNSTLPASTQIGITEQSTVTGVYALAGYMSGINKLSDSGSTLAQTGLTNAANTALGLSTLATGAPLAQTAAGGTVPVATINTLANILAACINSNGTGTACTTLFANATADGTSTGTVPTDTVTALLNIAHHPGANVAALFNLAAAAAPYGGGLATAPNDFTLAVSFQPVAGLFVSPGVPSVDASGNVTFASTVSIASAYYAVRVSPLGGRLMAYLDNEPGIQTASDSSGNTWIAHANGSSVTTVPSPGSISGPKSYSFNGNGNANDDGHQLAIDTSGNVYISDYTDGNVYALANNGTLSGSVNPASITGDTAIDIALLNNSEFVSGDNYTNLVANSTNIVGNEGDYANLVQVCGLYSCFAGGLSGPTALAATSNAYVWALNHNSTLSAFDTTGATNGGFGGYLPGSPFSGGGLNTTTKSTTQPYPWPAIDGANNIWVGNYTGSVSEFSPAGVALTPNAGTGTAQPGGFYGVAPTCKSQGLAIDGSGNLWVSCDSATTPILEYIGVATPVATPLLPGNFGVRP